MQENQPINPIPQPPTRNAVSIADAGGSQVEVDAKNFKNKLNNLIANLKTKYNALPKNSKILVILVGSLFAFIFLLLILSIILPKKPKIPVIKPSPTPVAVTPAPEIILNASKYATDEGVLKIESDLKDIQKQIESTDVRQSDLNTSNINFNVNFNK